MFTRILVPLDQSSLAEQATGVAAAIARASQGEVALVLAHEMAAYDGFLDSSWRDAKTPEETTYIRTTAEELAKGANVSVSGTVLTGRAVDVICRRAREVGADLIVMTSHGRTGLSRAWMGSVADGVMRHSPVPVLMLRSSEKKRDKEESRHLFKKILVPLDGSTTSSAIFPAAAAMARCGGGSLLLARVVRPIPLYILESAMPSYSTALTDPEATRQAEETVQKELVELAQRLEQEEKLVVETKVIVADHVAAGILDLARASDADLIAMTTHGRGSSRLMMGSVADKVLRGSGLPLLLLHPKYAGPERRGKDLEVEAATA